MLAGTSNSSITTMLSSAAIGDIEVIVALTKPSEIPSQEWLEAQVTALSLAAKFNHSNIVDYFLAFPDVRASAITDLFGPKGAFSEAIRNRRLPIAEQLLKLEGANDILRAQSNERVLWAFYAVLTCIKERSDQLKSAYGSDFIMTPEEHETNILGKLLNVVRSREIDISATLSAEALALLNKFAPARLSLQALASRLIPKGEWDTFLPHVKAGLERDSQRYKRQRGDVEEPTGSSSSSSSSYPSSSSSSSSSSSESSELDGFLNQQLLDSLKDLTFKDRCAFILEKKLFNTDIYTNDTWHCIAQMLNIRDDWHPELNDDQKLKVNSVFSIMDIVIERFPNELIEAIGLSEMAQAPWLNLRNRMGGTGYIDFIGKSDLGDESFAIGVDCYDRPFVTVAYDSSHIPRHPDGRGWEPSIRSGTQVETLFKRYDDFGTSVVNSTWSTGTSTGGTAINYAQQGGYSLHPKLLNYLGRLVHDEEVGLVNSVLGQDIEENSTLIKRKRS